jgi:1-acyl-sn-glycerol-3-phosphate acyltransferase
MRAFLAGIVVVVMTVIIGTSCILVWPISPRGWLQQKLMWVWARTILAVSGVRLDIIGRERIGAGPYVIVCNHSSMLDICLCAAVVPIPFRFVSRPFFFKIPFLGWGMYCADHISIDPKNPREAKSKLPELGKRLQRGVSVLLFPEGTRSVDGNLAKYRRGPFLTAIEEGAAVLPMHLSNAHLLLPKGTFSIQPGRVRVTFGDPVSVQGKSKGDARQMAADVEAWTREQAAKA